MIIPVTTVERWDCPKRCGYYREWNNHYSYLNRIMVHPVWGRVNYFHLVNLDIMWHDCDQYLLALERLHNGPGTAPVPAIPKPPSPSYPPAEAEAEAGWPPEERVLALTASA